MEIRSRYRLRLRVQNLAFLLLFGAIIGLLAWLSTRYTWQADWTAGARNTLSQDSQKLMARLEGAVSITAYVSENPILRRRIENLVSRYQRYKSDIALGFINPAAIPEQIGKLGISRDGEVYLEYRGRSEQLQQLTEQGLTNALQSLSRREQRRILFLTGHGERKPHGEANHDLGTFGRELERTGIRVTELNLVREPNISTQAITLVLASPQVDLLPGEIKLVQDYLNNGGNLLWLLEPHETRGLEELAAMLGIRPLPGVIVDADTPLFGIDNPTFTLVTDYGPHPITRDLEIVTLFPAAAALSLEPVEGWEPQELLITQPRTWTETGSLTGKVRFDADSNERSGPLTLGVALSGPRRGQENDSDAQRQRVVVLGDGDFLSNTYLGNGSNLDLGLNIVNWLTQDDSLIAIRAKSAPDQTLQLSDTAIAILGGWFLLALPAVLLGSGWVIWFRRRRR